MNNQNNIYWEDAVETEHKNFAENCDWEAR